VILLSVQNCTRGPTRSQQVCAKINHEVLWTWDIGNWILVWQRGSRYAGSQAKTREARVPPGGSHARARTHARTHIKAYMQLKSHNTYNALA